MLKELEKQFCAIDCLMKDCPHLVDYDEWIDENGNEHGQGICDAKRVEDCPNMAEIGEVE